MFTLIANRNTWAIYILLMTSLTIIAFNGLGEIPFDTDDFEYMADTAAVYQDLSLLLSTERQQPGRPVVELVLLAAYSLWGENAAAYHLLLIGLHLTASLLLAAVFHRLGADLELSFLGGLLFLLNVAHFRAIQWISCLAYPLALIFALGAVFCLIRHLEERRNRWQVCAVALLVLAVFSHASAAALTLFLAYLGWRHKPDLRSIFQVSWPHICIAALCGLLLYLLYPQSPQSVETAYSPAIADLVEKFLHFLGTLFSAGHWLTEDLLTGPAASTAAQTGSLIAGLIAFLGFIALAVRGRDPARGWALWTLLALLPFLFRSNEAMSRYLYLASAGSSLILAWLLRAALQQAKARLHPGFARIALVLILAGGAAASTLSLQRAEAFALYSSARAYVFRGFHQMGVDLFKRAIERDTDILPLDVYSRLAVSSFLLGESPQAILEEAAKVHPNSPAIDLFLGISYLVQDDVLKRREGEERLARTLAATGNGQKWQNQAAIAIYNLGFREYELSKGSDKALALFSRAAQLRPHYPQAHFFIGRCLADRNRAHDALAAFGRAIAQAPNFGLAYQALGFLLIEENEITAAVTALEKAVALEPARDLSWYLLAQAHRLNGQADSAHQAIRHALVGKPEHKDYWREYLALGDLYHTRGQLKRARIIYREVTQAIPELARAHRQLGYLYYNEGNYSSAIDSLQRAVQLSPQDPSAKRLLASARQMG